eukprot:TRINITY_DN1963_c1_g1_i1.p1 TRINITY_DN1963_c1_g1~~TRINITY_DN1963_c1_g1_i1.p1  ORF type:complete len:317 (-),score=107.36 TRINITY_DN1963_c1_g1_i1:95-1045(-)
MMMDMTTTNTSAPSTPSSTKQAASPRSASPVSSGGVGISSSSDLNYRRRSSSQNAALANAARRLSSSITMNWPEKLIQMEDRLTEMQMQKEAEETLRHRSEQEQARLLLLIHQLNSQLHSFHSSSSSSSSSSPSSSTPATAMPTSTLNSSSSSYLIQQQTDSQMEEMNARIAQSEEEAQMAKTSLTTYKLHAESVIHSLEIRCNEAETCRKKAEEALTRTLQAAQKKVEALEQANHLLLFQLEKSSESTYQKTIASLEEKLAEKTSEVEIASANAALEVKQSHENEIKLLEKIEEYEVIVTQLRAQIESLVGPSIS